MAMGYEKGKTHTIETRSGWLSIDTSKRKEVINISKVLILVKKLSILVT